MRKMVLSKEQDDRRKKVIYLLETGIDSQSVGQSSSQSIPII